MLLVWGSHLENDCCKQLPCLSLDKLYPELTTMASLTVCWILSPKQFTHINLIILIPGVCCYSHFTNGETEAQGHYERMANKKAKTYDDLWKESR